MPPTEMVVSRRIPVVLATLVILALGSIAVFLTYGVNGHWDYVLPRRTEQVVALVVVATAIAVSTSVFMTLTENRILTPSIMGFDALYILMATTLFFAVGSRRVHEMSEVHRFVITTMLLIGSATLAYRWVLRDRDRGIYTLLLVGVVASTLFSSVSAFMMRIMNPNEFDSLVVELFATFNVIDTTVLRIALVPLLVGILAAIRMIPVLDVLTLGRHQAVTLGVDYDRTATRLLMIVSSLVAVSTALVGPIVFLGLLVVNLAYQLTRTYRHDVIVPAAVLISIIALVFGQAVLQHVLDFNGTLGSMINALGGVVFVLLLVRESRS